MNRRSIFPVQAPAPVPVAGQYYFPGQAGGGSTTGALTVNNFRCYGWLVQRTTSIDKIGAEVTGAGEAGSKVRLGIYWDNGACLPGSLLLDAGTINGDSATVQDITLGSVLTLQPGLYWIGAASQVWTTTGPTTRICSSAYVPPMPMPIGTSAPTAGIGVLGVGSTSVTGALPGTFTFSFATGTIPRIYVRSA